VSATIDFHRAKEMIAMAHGNVAWLNVRDGSGNVLAIHLPYDTAKAIADAFNATFHKEPAE
jgi:signal transduction histidine kinase